MSSSNDTFEIGLMLVLMGGGVLWSALKKKKRARRFEDHQHIKISSAPQGHVELSGFAWPEKFVPGSNGKGIAYLSWQLEEYVKRGKNSEWRVVARGSKPSGFLLNDDTGSVWVDMNGAELESNIRYEKWGSISEPLKRIYLSLMGPLHVSGFPPMNSLLGGTYRIGFREINPGCPVVAHGTLNSSNTSKKPLSVMRGFEAYKQRYLKFLKNPAYRLSMLDSNQDGIVSEEEHRIGHVYAADATARKYEADLNAVEESVEVLGTLKKTEFEALVVADTHEAYLLKRLRSLTTLAIVGGALLIAAGASMFYFEFFESGGF